MDASTSQVKYIFMDIVGFTLIPSVEDQTVVIHKLGEIVTAVISRSDVPESQIILLHTGDGICISLLDVMHPFDIHILIAREILSAIFHHNKEVKDDALKFQIRIGLSENVDNVIEDVNGHRNLAGRGISTARRVMDLADGAQIIATQVVYEATRQRKAYSKAFRQYHANVKHGEQMPVYQFVRDNVEWLNQKEPHLLRKRSSASEHLSVRAAYYFAAAIKYRDSWGNRNEPWELASGALLLWYVSHDMIEGSKASALYNPQLSTPSFGQTFEEQFEFLSRLPVLLILDAWESKYEKELVHHYRLFENRDGMMTDHRMINKDGVNKLKEEHPSLWNELELSE